MKKCLPNFKFFTILLVLVLTASIANAQTRTATVSGNWSNIATWGGASVPKSGNDVVINNGITVTVNGTDSCASITIGGTNAAGGITITGTNSLVVTNGVTIGDLLDNSSGITIAVGGGTFSCATLTMADVTSSNDDIALTISTGTATISGDMLMNGAAGTSENNINVTGAGTLHIGGNISATNGSLSAANTSTVDYNGTSQTVRAITYSNLTLSGNGVKTVSGVTINGTLSLQGTATTTGTAPTYAAAATLEYKGSGAQIISDLEFTGTGANPANLRIDNTNGVTLNTAKTINGALTLVNGYLTTTGLLTINTAGSATTINGAFVNGQLAKAKNTTALFVFPVGTVTGGLREIGVTPVNTNATTYTARFFDSNPQAVYTGAISSPLTRISYCEYWTLDRSTAGTPANATVRLTWSAASCGGNTYVTEPSSLLIAKYNGTNWITEGNTSITPANTVTSVAISSFNAFTIGTSSLTQNPLPVMFADIKAFEKNNGVQVEWSNLTERDLVRYIVERSANGRDFTAISQQLPRSNQNDKESYSSFDASPLSGINFYRIKVLEISGKIIYSKILKVEIGRTQSGFTLYPNPVNGNQVTVGITVKKGQYTLRILNNAGQEIYSQQLIHQGGNMSQTVELPSSVRPGVYNMLISGDNYREAKMFVIQ